MKFSILIFLLILSGIGVFAQSPEKFESALMEMKGGAEVVYSSEKHSFTLDIISDKIEPLNKPGYVLVDNKTLQFVLIPNAALNNSPDTVLQKSQLQAYTKYELDYIKNELKLNYQNLHYEWLFINNKVFLLWYYDMPPAKTNAAPKNGNTITVAEKQINLSSMCFGEVLNLNTPFLHSDSFDDDKALLVKVAQTLKQNDFKIDFNELYKKLHQ